MDINNEQFITYLRVVQVGSLGFTVERVVYGGVRLVQGEMEGVNI
jgi:hypothetical protein